jgi:Predicted metal-dependent hydrolase of the TIM-barrel fold
LRQARHAHDAWQPWADELAAIARHTSACCKLSGLVTEAGRGWSVDALRRYVTHVLDCFGTGRVIWGSDWPVLTLAASYAEWVEAGDELLAGLTQGERDAIYGGNARRFYGLG